VRLLSQDVLRADTPEESHSPERFCPTVNRIEVLASHRDVCDGAGRVAYVSAKITREPDDGNEDDRQLRTTFGQEARPAKATTPRPPISR